MFGSSWTELENTGRFAPRLARAHAMALPIAARLQQAERPAGVVGAITTEAQYVGPADQNKKLQFSATFDICCRLSSKSPVGGSVAVFG